MFAGNGYVQRAGEKYLSHSILLFHNYFVLEESSYLMLLSSFMAVASQLRNSSVLFINARPRFTQKLYTSYRALQHMQLRYTYVLL